ncbi:ABC transporter ATP-binding protein (plasmid) [Agrobacterium vitis]|uniref:dipeptide ABC transporter ATP-binding protein n=1 Tax=Agrobacterium vitis TaxID=373 RepID=UPI0012E73AC6|nr:ABC transporter ATP-binding protein [Agrobacterium vitis]MVA27095.1 dipeptide ABC transporter ATP-binding protein [Agrobacterium vitis]
MLKKTQVNTVESTPLLSVQDLSVRFGWGQSEIKAVSNISFDVPFSGTVGIVGESGSGKSVTSLALTRLFPKSAKATIGGQIKFQDRDLVSMPDAELRSLRGKGISYVFQDPLSALNPVRRCGEQVAEAIRIHEPSLDAERVNNRVTELFDGLGLPRPKETMRKYPHEPSGGMRQRVMIAMALACKPSLLIADEPTTALDVIVQRQIVDLLRETIKNLGTSLLFISHDLALVSSITEQVIVMRDGKVVESGATLDVWKTPRDAYTKQLWDATPTLRAPSRPPLEVRQAPTPPSTDVFCAEGLTHSFVWGPKGKGRPFALDDVSIAARRGETVCIVGESGSGKSTFARCAVGLIAPDQGRISFDGKELVGPKANGWKTVRRDIQMVFQDPYASLNPRMKVAELVAEGLVINKLVSSRDAAQKRAVELLEMVGLQASHGDRYPHQFSGGQRQRIAIARALAVRPKLLVCDEPVTSLDVSIRAQIIKLLIDIQNQEGLTYLFITHDIALARQIGDRVVVMSKGRVVEAGAAVDVIDRPVDPYTRQLRAAVPSLPETPEEAHAAD